ncbi:MAG: type VI secretion system ATPase TssH, partial [Bacteroidales bacterium]|nr:type VI secretion system ATPase TssH [Bacteroidales bacterium]
IAFTPLTLDEIGQIVVMQLQQLIGKLAENHITLQYTSRVVDYLASAGFDPQFGARPIRRMIQRDVLNQLSRFILQGNLNEGATLELDSDGQTILFNVRT